MGLKRSRTGIAPGEYYHVFNRGVSKNTLFKDRADYQRFLFGTLYLQSPLLFTNVARIAKKYDSVAGFPVSEKDTEEILKARTVELTAFCLMSNHYHLLLRETEEGGISNYMHRLAEGYAKYFSTKYGHSGHVFQGPYKAVHVADDRQLTYLSAYIHKNPHDIPEWRGKEFEYPWSSLQDYTSANRWGGLIVPDIIVGQFERTKGSNYADFVRTSTAKVFAEELESLNLSEAS